ncbi:DUF1214 domain-containing protein [Vibrio jasicida]|uniref:DUF1214 domain-containing protein n=1 Tax=Vibrio jasicida TaxID=766224 RepID=UPI000CE3F197|nr:DUF1214 domain-containing protein [Vibrio jasicida]
MKKLTTMITLVSGLAFTGLAYSTERVELTDEQMDNLVMRTYPYVAMFNVNNKFALDESNPLNTGGYNQYRANTELADHTLKAIARPNNDTLYGIAMVDVTEKPIVMEFPAFDSNYVSLMVTAYDHYVNVPMSVSQGDFSQPSNILFYSERTPGYDGTPIKGVDQVFEVSGDFVNLTLRVMPHAAESERLVANQAALSKVNLTTLPEFLGNQNADTELLAIDYSNSISRNLSVEEDSARFPEFGSDFQIFEERFVEVMQFVVNHTTFDVNDQADQALLKALLPLGIKPGQAFNPQDAAHIDGVAMRKAAQRFATASVNKLSDEDFLAANLTKVFMPKGEISPELLALLSVVGPIGQPAQEALYPQLVTNDGQVMNTMHDYEVVMSASEMPPAKAFWSLTLYDLNNGFFIPNEHKKYSVGENAGYKLDEDGGIRIVVAAERPEGVPLENWLPIERSDLEVNMQMRLYNPDLEKYENWSAPTVRKIN